MKELLGHKDILRKIFCILLAVNKTHSRSKYHGLVFFHKQSEHRLVAKQNLVYNLLIGHFLSFILS